MIPERLRKGWPTIADLTHRWAGNGPWLKAVVIAALVVGLIYCVFGG